MVRLSPFYIDELRRTKGEVRVIIGMRTAAARLSQPLGGR